VKFRHCLIAAGMLMTLLLASLASAQTCGNNDFQLSSDGSSQGLLVVGNSGYRGNISSGNLSPGAWSIKFDDTGWPTSTNTRRTYVKGFYTYDATNHLFRAVFAANKVQIQLVNSAMVLNGTAEITLEAADANLNGTFDNTEFNGVQTVTANVSAPCGTSTPVCGGPGNVANGSVNGSGPVASPLLGAMTTQPCAVAVDAAIWGDVKTLFRD
jgi:hypothetical protein